MSDRHLQNSRFTKVWQITSTGFLGDDTGDRNLTGETSLLVLVEDVSTDNEVLIEGQLEGSKRWIQLGAVKGPSPSAAVINKGELIDISFVDKLRFSVTSYNPASVGIPKLIAKAFFSPTLAQKKLEEINNQQFQCLRQITSQLEIVTNILSKLEIQISSISGLDFTGD